MLISLIAVIAMFAIIVAIVATTVGGNDDTTTVVFNQARKRGLLPEGARHVSGSLETRDSDVDVLVPTTSGPERRETFWCGGREVNVLWSAEQRRRVARLHRVNGLRLGREFPELRRRALRLKKGGLGTEPAWAQVLGLEGCPYAALAQDFPVLREAAKAASP